MTVLHQKNCKLVCKCQMKATYELVPAVHEESENCTIFSCNFYSTIMPFEVKQNVLFSWENDIDYRANNYKPHKYSTNCYKKILTYFTAGNNF